MEEKHRIPWGGMEKAHDTVRGGRAGIGYRREGGRLG
jgi:hypothetical protein